MGVPTPRFVGGTQSSHGQLVGPISPALLPPSDVGCRPVERANGMPRRARRAFAASGKRVWVLRRNGGTPRGAACGPLPAGIWISFSGIPPWVTKSSARSVRPAHSLQRVSHSRARRALPTAPRWSPRCPSASHISHHSLSPPRAAGAGRARAAAHGAVAPPRRAHRRTARARSVRPHAHPSARSAAGRGSAAPPPAPPR